MVKLKTGFFKLGSGTSGIMGMLTFGGMTTVPSQETWRARKWLN